MKYLLLALLVLSTSAMAADAKKVSSVKTDTKGTLDVTPTSMKDEVSEDTPLVMDSKNVKVNITCKAKDGHELKHGDKGYNECLEKVKNDKHGKDADVKVDFKK
jgi:hypothetical protein